MWVEAVDVVALRCDVVLEGPRGLGSLRQVERAAPGAGSSSGARRLLVWPADVKG